MLVNSIMLEAPKIMTASFVSLVLKSIIKVFQRKDRLVKRPKFYKDRLLRKLDEAIRNQYLETILQMEEVSLYAQLNQISRNKLTMILWHSKEANQTFKLQGRKVEIKSKVL